MVPRIRVRKVQLLLQLQFEGGDGGFDSDECSDDGESGCNVVGLPSLTHLHRGADQDFRIRSTCDTRAGVHFSLIQNA